MVKFDDKSKENTKVHNPNWSQIPDHPCRIIITNRSRSEKTIFLLYFYIL